MIPRRRRAWTLCAALSLAACRAPQPAGRGRAVDDAGSGAPAWSEGRDPPHGDEAPSGAPVASMAPPAPGDAFDANQLTRQARVPGIGYAAFTRDGIVLEGAAGLASVAPERPLTADTALLAASIAKLVVAVAVMQLVEARRADLDADVSTYTGFAVRHPKHAGRPVTLRMLLTHTSSIRDDFARLAPLGPESARGASARDAARDAALADFLRGYLTLPNVWHDAAPGDAFAYSNVGTSIAAYAVARVERAAFAEVTRRRIFAPLGMRRTSWVEPPAGPRAEPYALTAEGYALRARGPYPVYPAVELWSTARDLGRFGCAILRGGELDGARVLSASSVEAMLREARPEQSLGWQLRTFGASHVVGHEGEDVGASTGLFLDPSRAAGAVVLANGDAFSSGVPRRAAALQELLEGLLARAARPLTR